MVPVFFFFYDNHNTDGVTNKYTADTYKKNTPKYRNSFIK